MAPPPAPSSLLGLPGPWLLSLVTCKSLDAKQLPSHLLSLFRTCKSFRDMVLRHRKAVGKFNVAVVLEDLAGEVDRLCTLARRSSNVKLVVEGPEADDPDEEWDHEYKPPADWPETEPHITHLLACAASDLGARSLACIKEVHLETLEHTALVPPWVRLYCPNVEVLTFTTCLLANPLPLPPPSAGTVPAQPLLCQHLRHVEWQPYLDARPAQHQASHIQQQLAALPSLGVLTTYERESLMEPVLVSTSLTTLVCPVFSKHDFVEFAPLVRGVVAQFPALQELCFDDLVLDDGGLEALLGLQSLRRVSVSSIDLQRSFVHRSWPWEQLHVAVLDVDSFARLPLERVPRCTWEHITPGRNTRAVARLVDAVRRWPREEAWSAGVTATFFPRTEHRLACLRMQLAIIDATDAALLTARG